MQHAFINEPILRKIQFFPLMIRAILLLIFFLVSSSAQSQHYSFVRGAITRGDSLQKNILLVFTGDEFGEGGSFIAKTLADKKIRASFFLTGNFYRNPKFRGIIDSLKKQGQYLGAHSDRHLLYCDWTNRDSLLVTKDEFMKDLMNNYREMERFGISPADTKYFLPPYEWYNDSISIWTNELGFTLINFTPGTRSAADYTTPEMGLRYVSSDTIFDSIRQYELSKGLNGFVLLLHIGTDPRRTDKFYYRLPALIDLLKEKGYRFVLPGEMFGKYAGH